MVARRVGGEKPEEAAVAAAAQSMLIGLIVSIVDKYSWICFAEDILRLMGGSGRN